MATPSPSTPAARNMDAELTKYKVIHLLSSFFDSSKGDTDDCHTG
jgi:hypothetical protein